ncbi:MAG: two-component regulator propeller domain-containing protein, partial [Flavitalea sp.]
DVVRKTHSSNKLIIAATAKGFIKINSRGKVTDSINISSLPIMMNAGITDFLEYQYDKLIVTASTGLFFLDWKTKDIQAAQFLPTGRNFSCIEKDNEGNFWIGSDSALYKVKKDFSLANPIEYDPARQLHNTVIRCIQKDNTGRMWIGSNTGLFIFDGKKVAKINPGNNDSLENINELFIDSKSTVWVCSEGKGLYQVYYPGIVFQHIPGIELFSKKQLIQTIQEEKPGSWLIGTKFGLYRYTFSSKMFEEIILTDAKNKAWIGAQLVDKNNGYWVGTWGQGVFYKPFGSNKFIQFLHEPQNENSLPVNTIVALEEDNNGNIWMGSFHSGNKSNSNSLCFFDPKSKKINRIYGTASSNTFNASTTSQIEIDNEHHLWIGSWDLGLNKYYNNGNAPQQNTFLNYTETTSFPYKISHNVVSCVRPGKNGKIWFGTISGGLNVFDKKTDSIYWFTVNDGLASNLIYRIEEDDQGILWISTDNGISRFDPSTKTFINYNIHSGLPANDYAFLTSLKCADGTIAFGTNNGKVVFFNPNASKHLTNELPVVITDIRLFNKSLAAGPGLLLNKSAYLTDTLQLRYDHSVISFELSNMDFLNAEISSYAYKLDGFDENWTYITDKSSITYTNLDPGTYTLLIKNSNHLGIWNETPKKLAIIIQPPFYKTWWFNALVMVLVASMIYAVFKYRLQQKLNIFSVRNRLHRDLHDDVGATLSSVKAYSEILKDNPDNPVIAELIKINSTEMLERLEVISWATNPEHDNYKSLKSKMVKFAAPLCHSKNIQFTIDSKNINEEMVMSGEVRQNIFLVFKEAINNMIKYAEATNCSTELSISKNNFVLQIADNGKGFDGTIKGTGQGCKNIKKRTENLNGKLVIDSTLEKGTIITMSIPYPFKIPSSWDRKKSW